MQNSDNWIVDSIGGSFYDGDIKALSVGFVIVSNQFNIDYSRSLIIKGIECFLESINSNNRAIFQLNHFPFTYQNVKYHISIYTADRKWLGAAFLINGKLCYYKVDELRNLEKIYEEPYLEALHKIKAGLAIPAPQLQNLKPLSS